MVDWAGVGGQQGISTGFGGQLAGTRNAPTDFITQPATSYAQKSAFAQAINNVLAAVVNDKVDVNDAIEQAFAQLNDKTYGQGFYGHGAPLAGMQGQNNASLLGSAAGLVNTSQPGYADAQGYSPGYVNENFDPMGSSHMGQYSPTNSSIQITGSSPGIFNGAGFSNFYSADQPADDFANLDPSIFVTETAESGPEFDTAAAKAALQAELGLEPDTTAPLAAFLEELALEPNTVVSPTNNAAFAGYPNQQGVYQNTVQPSANPAFYGYPNQQGVYQSGVPTIEITVPSGAPIVGSEGGGERRRKPARIPDYERYVDMYDDLLAAQPDHLSKADWGRRHWERHGGAEGRRFGPNPDELSFNPNFETQDVLNPPAIANPGSANPVAYGNAFAGVTPRKSRRNVYQDSASMGWI